MADEASQQKISEFSLLQEALEDGRAKVNNQPWHYTERLPIYLGCSASKAAPGGGGIPSSVEDEHSGSEGQHSCVLPCAPWLRRKVGDLPQPKHRRHSAILSKSESLV